VPPAVFEPTIPASEWPQTYALYRVVTETGIRSLLAGINLGDLKRSQGDVDS
jgi:hypothetical protein